MTRQLRKNERCPIHNSRFCCGRKQPTKNPYGSFLGKYKPKPPVQRIPDKHHKRGYIEVCNEGEKRKRKGELLQKDPSCMYCGKVFTDYREAELEHIEPRPAGCAKDSHRDNLGLACHVCNTAKGSRRL